MDAISGFKGWRIEGDGRTDKCYSWTLYIHASLAGGIKANKHLSFIALDIMTVFLDNEQTFFSTKFCMTTKSVLFQYIHRHSYCKITVPMNNINFIYTVSKTRTSVPCTTIRRLCTGYWWGFSGLKPTEFFSWFSGGEQGDGCGVRLYNTGNLAVDHSGLRVRRVSRVLHAKDQ